MKLGFERVGEPSELRSGRGAAASRSPRGSSSASRARRSASRARAAARTSWPLPVRSWGAPPVARGACSGFSAGGVSVAGRGLGGRPSPWCAVSAGGASGAGARRPAAPRAAAPERPGRWWWERCSTGGTGLGSGRRRHRLGLGRHGDRERREEGGHDGHHRQHGHGQLHRELRAALGLRAWRTSESRAGFLLCEAKSGLSPDIPARMRLRGRRTQDQVPLSTARARTSVAPAGPSAGAGRPA